MMRATVTRTAIAEDSPNGVENAAALMKAEEDAESKTSGLGHKAFATFDW